MGSYVNRSLRHYATQDDWRVSKLISGSRVDAAIYFTSNNWGSRASVGVTGGSDDDWDSFSVQWDGYIEVLEAGTRLASRSDDGSRMWIDFNNDGQFDSSGPEFLDNHWGAGQAATVGPRSDPLPVGLYRIRIQYEEGDGANLMTLPRNPPGPVAEPTVRVAYLIPSNRMPQTNAVFKLQRMMLMFQQWYFEQMSLNLALGTFRLEQEEETGVIPKIHVFYVPETDDYLRTDAWGRTWAAASFAGVPLWQPSQVWLVVPETHLQLPDGAILGGPVGGTGSGSGHGPGVGMLGSDGLARFEFLTDDRPYHGLIVPEFGPYPLQQNISFPWYEGTTLSSVSSSIIGAALHEFSHGFGLAHDFRNDENFHGNMMGNGLRGIRGYFYPDRYPNDYTRLGYGTVQALRVNQYFGSYYPAEARPSLTINTTGAVTPTNGQVQIEFTADSGPGATLSVALLQLEGNLIGEMDLREAFCCPLKAAFLTPFYTAGQSNHYTVSVFNYRGDKQSADTFITPATGHNGAPRPFIKVSPPAAAPGQPVTFNAELSRDPDHDVATLQVEWDRDGNGTFDTSPTTVKAFTTNFAWLGLWRIRVRVTDPAGAQSISDPLWLRTREPDTTAPTLTVASSPDFAYVTNSTVALTGLAEDSSGILWVTVNGQLVAPNSPAYPRDLREWRSGSLPLVLSSNTIGVTNTFILVAADKATPVNYVTNVHHIIQVDGSDGDGDQLPDYWELRYFGSIQAPDALPEMDPDHDGLTNWQEYLAGTNPGDANSTLRFLNLWTVGSHYGLELRAAVQSVAGRVYQVEYRDDPASGSWRSWDARMATGSIHEVSLGMLKYSVPVQPPPKRFYRVRLVQ